MRRALFASAASALALSVTFTGNAVGPYPDEIMEEVFRVRMAVLERTYSVHFQPGSKPSVRFLVPRRKMDTGTYQWYSTYAGGDSFLIHPRFRGEIRYFGSAAEVMAKLPDLVQMTDHELGHLLASQIAARLNQPFLPFKDKQQTMPFEVMIGMRIVSEGIASYFGATTGHLNGHPTDEVFPEKLEKIDLVTGVVDFDDICYPGGEWLVTPVIQRYGERGVAYLVSHPFVPLYDTFQASVHTYQRVALEELASESPP